MFGNYIHTTFGKNHGQTTCITAGSLWNIYMTGIAHYYSLVLIYGMQISRSNVGLLLADFTFFLPVQSVPFFVQNIPFQFQFFTVRINFEWPKRVFLFKTFKNFLTVTVKAGLLFSTSFLITYFIILAF